MLDTHLDLLDTVITSKKFVFFRDVLKTSSRYVFKTSSRHVFKTSSRHVLKTSSSSQFFVFQDVFKTSWGRLQDMSSRRLQDVFKTNRCLLGLLYLYLCFLPQGWLLFLRHAEDFLKVFIMFSFKSFSAVLLCKCLWFYLQIQIYLSMFLSLRYLLSIGFKNCPCFSYIL